MLIFSSTSKKPRQLARSTVIAKSLRRKDKSSSTVLVQELNEENPKEITVNKTANLEVAERRLPLSRSQQQNLEKLTSSPPFYVPTLYHSVIDTESFVISVSPAAVLVRRRVDDLVTNPRRLADLLPPFSFTKRVIHRPIPAY